MIIFTHPERPTQMLIKVTARMGDDLWVLSNGELLATINPVPKANAMRRLTPENGWTMHEVFGPKFEVGES